MMEVKLENQSSEAETTSYSLIHIREYSGCASKAWKEHRARRLLLGHQFQSSATVDNYII